MIGAIVVVEIFFLGLGSFERAIPLPLFFFGARDPLGQIPLHTVEPAIPRPTVLVDQPRALVDLYSDLVDRWRAQVVIHHHAVRGILSIVVMEGCRNLRSAR